MGHKLNCSKVQTFWYYFRFILSSSLCWGLEWCVLPGCYVLPFPVTICYPKRKPKVPSWLITHHLQYIVPCQRDWILECKGAISVHVPVLVAHKLTYVLVLVLRYWYHHPSIKSKRTYFAEKTAFLLPHYFYVVFLHEHHPCLPIQSFASSPCAHHHPFSILLHFLTPLLLFPYFTLELVV